MEANGQTLYNDDLLNILPDGVIILDINREVIQLNQQAFTELHVHSSINAMMPLPTNKIFKLLNKKEDILSTILEEIRQGKKVYSLPEHTFMQEQVDYTQFPIRGEFATMENEEGEKNILFFFRNITVELTQEYILNTALQRTKIYPWYYDISRSEFTLDDRYFEHLGIPAGENNTLTMEEYVNMIHPDDRQTMADAFVVQLSGNTTFDKTVPFRLRRGDGTWEWFEGQSTYIANISGHPYRLVGICLSIQEYKDIENTLIEARKKAEESDRLKMAFLANMSHEIRTPLNAIVGFSDLLMVTEDQEEKEEFIQIINANNELLLKLINDILDLSKIEAGSVELKYENFDLAVYFNELAASMHRRVVNPQVRLVPVNPYEACTVRLDKNRLAQILTNFVTNAIKYTSKGTIEMGYEKIDENIRLYVRDTGIGIPEDKKDKVFHRFEKLDEFAQGTGLGLSICKAIVEACRGEIGFESEFDKGSLFWAVLPCQFESVNSEPTSSRRNNEKDANKENILDSEETKKVPKRVLVVEDIQSNFFLVSSILKNKCQLLHAPNGLEAVEIVRTQPVDLVLMDMKMPVMDGRTATSEIRKFNAEIPIIALTAHAFDADRVAALKAGCDDYLVKPINGAKLMQTLKEYGC